MASGDKKFVAKDFRSALVHYQTAKNIKPADPDSDRKIKLSHEEITREEENAVKEKEYKESIAAGDQALEKKDYNMAIKYYEKARGIKPNDVYATSQIEKAKKGKE